MERLTYRGENGKPYVRADGYYHHCRINLDSIAERLAAYEDAEEQGLLRLPCWIPVTERLPKQGKRYLVVRYDYVTETPFVDILWHDAHDLWWNRLYKGQYNVTHWMPLPEPPKEG